MCTGYGGFDLAAHAVYGGELRWCADNDPHATALLHHRFPGVPNIGDLTTADWTKLPAVDIVTAGFPCQDISYAGRGAGIKKGTRSGLWYVITDALRLLRPALVLLENVAALRTRGITQVLGDLATLGYNTAWTCLRASDIGAPHRRERIFIIATDPTNQRIPQKHNPGNTDVAEPPGEPVRRCPRPLAADTDGIQPQRRRTRPLLAGPCRPATTQQGHAAQHRHTPAPDAVCQRQRIDRTTSRDRRQPEAQDGAAPHNARGRQCRPARFDRLTDLPERTDPATGNDPAVDWGAYALAIHRWEAILGRPAPQPTETGRQGQRRLNARFVEWMMGLPPGWITDVPICRTAQMRLLGNGVVPGQAIAALHELDNRLSATWSASVMGPS